MKKCFRVILSFGLCAVILLSLVACTIVVKEDAGGKQKDTTKQSWSDKVVGEWENTDAGMIFRFTFLPDGTGEFYEYVSGRTYRHNLTWETEEPNIIHVKLDDDTERTFTYKESYILNSVTDVFFYRKG